MPGMRVHEGFTKTHGRFNDRVLVPRTFGEMERRRSGRRSAKYLVLVGIVLTVLGASIAVRGGISSGSRPSAVNFSELAAYAVEQRPLMPAWGGGIAMLGGVLLVGVGIRIR